MRYLPVLCLFVLPLLTGCSDDGPQYSIDESAIDEVLPTNPSTTASGPGIHFGIGDVESALRVEMKLAPSALSGTVTQQVQETKLEWVAKTDARVAFPYPNKLEVGVGLRSIIDYPEHSSRITTNVYVEDKIIHTFKFITGKNAVRQKKIELIDVMPHLDLSETDSVLMHARAEIEFFPNTPEEELSLDTPARPDTTRATKISNPMRITFIP